MNKLSYRRHRFPGIVIQHAIWLYFRFPLSYRDVEDMLAERGIDVSYETVRRWALKFGTVIARKLETRTAAAGPAVASRRSVRLHQRQIVVRLACRGQRRRGPGHSRSIKARRCGSAQTDAKTPEEPGHHPSHDRDRPAPILRFCVANTGCCMATRNRALEKQPSRELPSALAATGTTDETLQVSWIGAALPINPRRRL